MIINYNNTDLDLFSRGTPDKIMLSLSGGLDSASLLFCICKYFPEIEIIPYTGKDAHSPFDFLSAQMILQWMKERFPDHKIREHEWFEFDVSEPDKRAYAESKWEEEKVMVNGELVERCATISGLVKILEIRKFTHETWVKHGEPLIVTGMTANPPDEEMIEHGFFDLRERRRDGRSKNEPYMHITYQPFTVVDKRFVAGIYAEENLWDLYELTGSCVGSAEITNYFTEPCGQCFWCNEKEWAFKDVKPDSHG